MEQIRQLEEQISDLETQNEELNETLAELRVAKSSFHKAQEDAELVLQEARHKAVNNASQIDVTVSNIQQNERDIGELKNLLENTSETRQFRRYTKNRHHFGLPWLNASNIHQTANFTLDLKESAKLKMPFRFAS